MKVSTEELANALSKTKPGLATNDIINQGGNFAFKDGFIHTYNDEITVRYPFESGITCAVPSKDLMKFVNRVKVPEIKLEMDENSLKISGSRLRAVIHCESSVELPLDTVNLPEDDEWEPIPGRFMEGLKMCYESAGRDSAQQSVECIHIEENIMESFDNFRLTVFEMEGDWLGESLIPARNLIQLKNCDPIKYVVTEDWIHFLNRDGSIFSTRPYEDVYENLDEFLDVEGPSLTFPDEIKDCLIDAEIFADEEAALLVEVKLSKNLVTVKGEGPSGWLEEKARMRYTGKDVVFQVNPQFFCKVISVLQDVTIGANTIKFKGPHAVHVLSLGGEE